MVDKVDTGGNYRALGDGIAVEFSGFGGDAEGFLTGGGEVGKGGDRFGARIFS